MHHCMTGDDDPTHAAQTGAKVTVAAARTRSERRKISRHRSFD